MNDENGQQEPANANEIQPIPVPFGYFIASGNAPDGSRVISMTLTLPTGRTVIFFPPEFGNQMARDIMQHTSGIEIARAVPQNKRFTPKVN